MIPDHLRIQPGQEYLTPAQEAEARRFAQTRVEAQLSTEPVNEAEVEALLQQIYQGAALSPPDQIRWLESPQQFEQLLRTQRVWDGVWGRINDSQPARGAIKLPLGALDLKGESWWGRAHELVCDRIAAGVWQRVGALVPTSLQASVRAYLMAADLAPDWFWLVYYWGVLEGSAFAQFNERLSGYWFGQEQAILVRRPCVLCRDPVGHLHSETGKCLEYRDGWGFYAWHGVRVPEQVILHPDQLTREDYLTEPNVEVARVIQERMGSRFVTELGGQVIDTSLSGTLYEVALPGDPEHVARYVQVQDASTPASALRWVPPTIQTVAEARAAEAVSWSFQRAGDVDAPAHAVTLTSEQEEHAPRDPVLRIQPDHQILTPEQEGEARRFAEERIAAQLSTEPVDELEMERLVLQVYVAAGLRPPVRLIWLDGPLQLVAVLAPQRGWHSLRDRMGASGWDRVRASVWHSVWDNVWHSVWHSVRHSVEDRVRASMEASLYYSVRDSVADSVGDSVGHSVQASVWHSLALSVWASLYYSVSDSVRDSAARAYFEAPWLAVCRFLDEYLAPNAAQALAHFNEGVSGYWLGQDTALLVRRPSLLARDQEGRLHSASGTCLEYLDGWGISAWHGVRVPEKVILTPEQLTREDFLNEPDVEVRRIIQERMGQRFVPELGGVVIDRGPRGALFEVALPEVDPDDDSNNDPERVARYVQVQDPSTERQYFLRVPPTIQTAAEAVAWTFQVSVEDYHPAQET